MVRVAISAGQVFVDLGARLDRREFEAYEKQLRKVQERTAKREHFKAELGANFDSRAFNAYERELRKAEHANDNMVRANGRLRTSFGNVWSRGGAAFAAAGGAFAVVSAVKSVVGAYGDAEASAKRVQTAVDNVGLSYKEHRKEIDRVIAAQSKLSAFDDEDLADSFARFVTQTHSVNEALKLNALTTDVARGRQISLESAQRLVARASQGNATALKRLGIEIDPVTKATDKLKDSHDKATTAQKTSAKETDKTATAQRTIAALQQKFGGQAEAYGKTQQGSIERVGVAWENLRENLGQKLAPTVTRVANTLSDFIDGMSSGEGAGGRFARKMERDVLPALKQIGSALRIGGRLVGRFFEDFTSNERQVGGWVSGFGRAESAVLKFTGKLVGGSAGDKLREWGHNVDKNADAVDRWRRQLTINREVNKIEDDLDRLKNKTNGTLHGILTSTHRNMAEIRHTMGTETARGQDAIHDNFQAAVTAIRRAMRQGNISTKTGMAQIRRDMLLELRELGISSALRGGAPLSKHPPKGDLPVTTNSPAITKYMGGWLGGRGLVGHDSIPAMLAPGEAVLNRHQQAVIEGMLGEGFLDRLFAQVNRPHFMQRGGRIRMAVGGVTPAISSLIEELDSKGFRHGSTTGGTHAPNSYHYRGMAVDYGDASNDMQKLWSVVFPQRTRFAELFGPTRVKPGPHLMHNGAAFQNAGLQQQHEDHIHMALAAAIGALGAGSASGALGAVWNALKAPQTTMGGLLGDVVQGTLDRATSLANQRGRALAKTASGDTDGLSGFKGGGSNAANRALGKRMAAAVGWTGPVWEALDRLWTGESGWNARIPNAQGSGAYGIPQALPASKMASAGADWRTNPATQIKWGIGYIKERYGGPVNAYQQWLSRSPHWYAKGGRVGGERAWLNRSWAQVAPLFGLPGDSKLGSLFKHIRFSKANAFVGVSSDPGARGHETDELLWPRWLWQGSKNQRALDNRSKLQLFIHEMAHRFQSHEATPSEWETEGGAEAFARIAMDRQFGGRRSSKGDPYNAYVTRVVKRRGMDWIARAQFGKAMGGFVNFARGGRAGSKPPRRPSIWQSSIYSGTGGSGGGTKLSIKSLRAMQTDSVGNFDAVMARVESARDEYQRWDTRYGLTDEGDLIDPETGEPNVGAIRQKLQELGRLVMIRAGIERDLTAARTIAQRVITTYKNIVSALRKSLGHAKKKDRSGIRSRIKTYDARLTEWRGKAKDLGGDIFTAHTDVLDIQGELKEAQAALGGSASIRADYAKSLADAAADAAGTTDTDTTTADPTTAPPTPLQIAEGVAAEMRTVLSGRQELLQSFGRNYLTPGGAGAYFSGRDALDASAGARFFGGSSGGGSLGGLSGGSTVIANFASAPDNAPTFVQQMRFLVENGSSG